MLITKKTLFIILTCHFVLLISLIIVKQEQESKITEQLLGSIFLGMEMKSLLLLQLPG